MSESLKILIVRFSSIGDIVLTTPVIRSVKNQLQAEVHFLTKYQYHSLIVNNPNLDKVYYLNDSIFQTLKDLRKENYDYIIDLHNNLRSSFLITLGVPVKRYFKSNFKKFIYINFGINNLRNEHVVDRYMRTVNFLGVKNDNKGLDYFMSADTTVDFNTDQKFIAWCIGASQIQKQLSAKQIYDVCSKFELPIILLGGEEVEAKGNEIIKASENKNLYNFCGKLTLDQSAYIIKSCFLLLSNDTSLMHIGAAFQKNIISFWGCTKPDMGFAPYISNKKSINIISSKSKRQCSKHGSSCRFTNDGCIKLIESKKIYDAVKSFAF